MNAQATMPFAGSAPVPMPTGSLEAYIQTVSRFPILSLEEERSLARRWRDEGELDAARNLVLSHLRLVVAVARGYLGYGLPHADLIQEGNIGLMKAVKRFDPERGVRLVSFAIHWIKAEIHEYILRNWRLVKVATTKAQRKLFFNLRSMKSDLAPMSGEDIERVASELRVKPEEVVEMETRLSGQEIAFEADHDDEEAYAPVHYLAADRADHADVALAGKHATQPVADDGVIVCEQNRDASIGAPGVANPPHPPMLFADSANENRRTTTKSVAFFTTTAIR